MSSFVSNLTQNLSSLSFFHLIPFFCILLSIALGPYFFKRIWHLYEKIILFFISFLSLFLLSFALPSSFLFHNLTHTLVLDYIPLVSMLFAIFTITGGFHLNLRCHPTARNNTLFLAVASLLANIFGTTGATLLFVRTFIRLNHQRFYRTHHMLFFIFCVANIGGCLTPIGDPPLFIGFLKGVDFFWPLSNLFPYFLGSQIFLLTFFFLLDRYFIKKEPDFEICDNSLIPNTVKFITLEGKRNIFFLILFFVLILLPHYLPQRIIVIPFGEEKLNLFLSHLFRDGALILIGCLSYLFTPKKIHKEQRFSYAPIREIAILFFVMFVTLIPLPHLLKVHELTNIPTTPSYYFWATGLASAFLDNAPTYITFFDIALTKVKNVSSLMTEHKSILIAISLGSVFMGALTYIGNTPNLIVHSIAKQSQIKMPSFLLYLLYAILVLFPLFLVITFFLR